MCFFNPSYRRCWRSCPSRRILLVLFMIACADARKSRYFDRDNCQQEILDMQKFPNFTTKNTPDYFRQAANGSLHNGPSNLTVTLKGCNEFCGPPSRYWDAGPRITTWIIPVLLLLSNMELSPIDKKRFMTVVHALGDPIDSFWSLIHKIYIWHRLYLIGLSKSPEVNNTSPAKSISNSALATVRTRHERARIIATVLAGFEEISSAKIESEDYYHMILYQLGRIGKKDEDKQKFEEWCHAARVLADARTNEFLRTCLAIFVYIFGLIAAFIPSVGGGNTSPPGGRIGSALYLSWLVPLVLLSNVIGGFTSRRTCLTIMRIFVTATTRLAQIETAITETSPIHATTLEDKIPPTIVGNHTVIGRSNNQHEKDEIAPARIDKPVTTIEPNTPSPNLHKTDIQDAITQIAHAPNPAPSTKDDNAQHIGRQGQPRLEALTNVKTTLIDITPWDRYFGSLQWLGAIYTYRPWKVLYLDIDHTTHSHRRNVMMVLSGVFPIAVSMLGAFAIIWYAVPVGFSCRHSWVIGIFVLWILSVTFTSLLYVYFKNRYTGHTLWKIVLVKDGFISGLSILMIFLSTGGLFNNCYCWSAYWMRGGNAYVPLNAHSQYEENALDIYSVVVATVMGAQILFFLGIILWWRHGLQLVRWTESRRRGEWKHEMSEDLIYTDDTFLLFWYRSDQLKQEERLRLENHRRYSLVHGTPFRP